MTFRRACCTLLAINNMNGADSEGREEKRRRINKRDREARVRETAEEREARLARRRATASNPFRDISLCKYTQNLSVLLASSLLLPRCVCTT